MFTLLIKPDEPLSQRSIITTFLLFQHSYLVLAVLQLTRDLDLAFAAPVDLGHDVLKLDASGGKVSCKKINIFLIPEIRI